MTGGEVLWTEFVAVAGRDAALLGRELGARDAARRAGASRLGELAHVAFRVGLSSLLMGAEDVGRLALGVEHALEHAREGALDDAAWSALCLVCVALIFLLVPPMILPRRLVK